mmetsp:Transcript_62135/g.166297  ORF Transcript_62135/g.166297 Transcript_62135/m.166297 type:complete len:204 (+) Transcript_62135:24-635(+)
MRRGRLRGRRAAGLRCSRSRCFGGGLRLLLRGLLRGLRLAFGRRSHGLLGQLPVSRPRRPGRQLPRGLVGGDPLVSLAAAVGVLLLQVRFPVRAAVKASQLLLNLHVRWKDLLKLGTAVWAGHFLGGLLFVALEAKLPPEDAAQQTIILECLQLQGVAKEAAVHEDLWYWQVPLLAPHLVVACLKALDGLLLTIVGASACIQV